MLSTALVSLAELSNVFSVLTVFLVFCAMVVFILRLHGDDYRMTSVTYTTQPDVQPIPMVKVINPFTFNFSESQNDINEVSCTISSQVPWMLQALWGVTITDFHHVLMAPWTSTRDMITTKTFLSDKCLQRGNLEFFPACTDLAVLLSPPRTIRPEDLGDVPRSRYPLVLLLVTREDDCLPQRHVGAMANVIHVRDSACAMATGIVGQYVKTTDGLVTNLKQLYLADKNVDAEASDDIEIGCVACQSGPATRALLPCRHVCICWKCFPRVDKCPMCRGYIYSYFCVRDEPASEILERSPPQETPVRWRQRLTRWNDWLNRTMGIT